MEKQLSLPGTRVMCGTVKFWFVVMFTGQLIFAYYILMHYWGSAMQGHLEKWNTVRPGFYIKGNIIGNVMFGLHVALAAIITILGPLQLITKLRSYSPKFHRISGRVYIFSAFLIAIAGLYLTLVKGAAGGMFPSICISINALIIMTCAYYAIKTAIERKIDLHQRWAVHLFLGMSGVWFFRVFLMLWLAIFQEPVGFDPKSFTGPFLNVLAFLVYVFPQVIAAFYFQAKRSEKTATKWAFTIFLVVITLGTAIGIFAATMGMWLPEL